jgi:serine protease Do
MIFESVMKRARVTRSCYCNHSVAIAAVTVTIVCLLLAFNNFLPKLQFAEAQIITNHTSETVKSATNPLSLSDLYSRVQKSVVQVSDVLSSMNVQSARLGSGFFYDKEGHIITNYHVVQPNARNAEFDVTFSDGSAYTARLVGSDPYSDLAVLKIQDAPPSQLEPLSIVNSSNLLVGDTVVAIGNPFGLAGSMSTGIVSGLSRILPSTDEDPSISPASPSFSIPNIIQTDAAINPGNSGGPLLNAEGKVIGINTAIYSNTGFYAGVGFAVPSDTILKIVPSLIRDGTYQHPYLGIAGTDVSKSLAKQMGLENIRGGFLITSVTPGGPADKFGLQAAELISSSTGRPIIRGGDVILKIDNHDVKKIDDVISYLERSTSVGDTVNLTVSRDGQIKEQAVVLDARPSPSNIQNVAGGALNPDFGQQSPNDENGGNPNENDYERCSGFMGKALCDFFFGK